MAANPLQAIAKAAMDYPRDFSTQAQNRVEAEQIRAARERDARIRETNLGYSGDTEKREGFAIDYILRVFLAFAKEACALGRSGTWTISRIRSEVDSFLLQLARDVEREVGPRGGPGYIRELTVSGSLERDVKKRFEESKQWKEYEVMLLSGALCSGAEAAPQSEAPAQTSESLAPVSPAMVEHDHLPKTGAALSPDRRAMVEAYLAEVSGKTGKRITKADVWKTAGYTSRTEFERWERRDPKHVNKAANERFMRVLREKPHLKPSAK